MSKDFKSTIDVMKEVALVEARSIYTSHQVYPEDAYMYAVIMRVLLGTGKFYFIDTEVDCMNSIIEYCDCADEDKNDLDFLKKQAHTVIGAVIDCLNEDKNRMIDSDGCVETFLTDEKVSVINTL